MPLSPGLGLHCGVEVRLYLALVESSAECPGVACCPHRTRPLRFCSRLLPVSLVTSTTSALAFIAPVINLNVRAYSKFIPIFHEFLLLLWQPIQTSQPPTRRTNSLRIQREQQLAGSRLSVPPFVLVSQPTCVRFCGRAPFDSSRQLIVT